MWPEIRASFRLYTGRELAKTRLDEFVEHVIWYLINAPDEAPRKREALFKSLRGESVDDGDDLTINKAANMMDQLDDFESWRTSRV